MYEEIPDLYLIQAIELLKLELPIIKVLQQTNLSIELAELDLFIDEDIEYSLLIMNDEYFLTCYFGADTNEYLGEYRTQINPKELL